MEPTQLQLVLNVVMITGVTSLGGYCYLLKKENRRLAAQRKAESGVKKAADSGLPTVCVQTAAPSTKPTTVSIKGMGPDVRNFAAGRRSEWVKNLASSIS